ncbi:MAG: lipoyl(octanoyl) transferase LipB [Paludibacter sp.]|jgi:lipoyl(octanoyl) transferase
MIQFQDWGEVPYNEAWERQEQIFSQTIDRKLQGKATENTMIFCEHPHVYTLGKSGDEHNLLIDYIQMQAAGAQFVKTNRGGDITYHGPGQIVGYPVFDLNSFNIGLKKYIELLEEVVILTLKDVGIYAERFPGATGVWLDVGKPSARKICAIGVRSSRFVTMHGFALNVNTDLTYFSHINPCGFVDKGVTSVQKELGHSVDVEMIKSKLKLSFQQVFLIQK